MNCTIAVHLLPKLIAPSALSGATAVVIDVLRASTVIIEALAAGAAEVRPCSEVEEARRIAARLPAGSALLGGERSGLKIEGFDLGNSPCEYASEVVAGKTIVLTTTNGTAALASVAPADRVLIAAFTNLSAVAMMLAHDRRPIHLVCAGTRESPSPLVGEGWGGGARAGSSPPPNPPPSRGRASWAPPSRGRASWAPPSRGRALWATPSRGRALWATDGEVSRDDVLCAGALADALAGKGGYDLSDSARIARTVWRARRGDLAADLRESAGGRNLVALGLEHDIADAARLDLHRIVPQLLCEPLRIVATMLA